MAIVVVHVGTADQSTRNVLPQMQDDKQELHARAATGNFVIPPGQFVLTPTSPIDRQSFPRGKTVV